MERFQSHSLRAIEQQTIEKRTAWWNAREAGAVKLNPAAQPTPRLAFETLFFEHMGLTPADFPILHEDDNEIVWEPRNPRPTLEACRQAEEASHSGRKAL